ncbi:hypothetical protein J8J14_04715 [Roseomonas sp. SSH11]|uniref:Uncharacterized protein n=1 Tax=Pararoseomonas baculiformis TaxID=2820812 RepID=A0ABS4AAQ1_9PROT|nr:hypothetical protein [Pararoseomonas baculiformis]MBP0444073.1 hypothetical protein [Pararoseomonas baculiformis]
MIRAGAFGASLLLAILAMPAGAAETCSSSTLVSPDYSVARWCGVPPGAGTLRMIRRGGSSDEFRNVPLDTYREVIRTPNVTRYVAQEIQPNFQRAAGLAAPPRPSPAVLLTPTPAAAAPHPRPVRQNTTPARPVAAAAMPASAARARAAAARPARAEPRLLRPAGTTGAERPAASPRAHPAAHQPAGRTRPPTARRS